MRRSTRAQQGGQVVTLSRRVLLGTMAATILPSPRGQAQHEPIRIGVLNDQSGLYRDFSMDASLDHSTYRRQLRRTTAVSSSR
jgi:hypothetical protein